jgi:hypothetical protein
MKNLLLISLIFSCSLLNAQPFKETILTNNVRSPRVLEIVDFNGNGMKDMVIAGYSGFTWYQNLGEQQFQAYSLYDDISIGDMQVVDYNSNSHPDIVGINAQGNTLFRLMNDGEQNFTYHLITDTLTSIRKIKVVDVDGDNNMDIFVCVRVSSSAYDIYLYENMGGEFISHYVDRVNFDSDIYVFDYNGNGYKDFLTIKRAYPITKIGVMINDGTNTFTETIIYEKSGNINISHAQFTDLNTSGTKDLIIADHVNNEFYWFENGEGQRNDIVTGLSVSSFLIDDFNGNGVNELIYQFESSGNSNFRVLEVDNSGAEVSFTEVNSYEVTGVANSLEPIDVNSDGINHFAYTIAATNIHEVGLFYNENNELSFSLTKISTSESHVNKPRSLKRVDLNQDGNMDILVFGNDTDIIWFKERSNGTYEQQVIISTLNNLRQFEVVDINNNGFLDIITASPGNHTFSIWYNDGNQTFTEQKLTSTTTQISTPTNFSVADLNNNGLMDFVVVGSSLFGSQRGIFWIRNEGDGNFSAPIPIQTNLVMMGEVITYDFDGNGWIDIVVANGQYSTEGLRVIKNLGNETFWVTQPSSTRAVSLRLGDIDNDGLMDFVTRDQENKNIVWFRNNGDFTFTENIIPMDEERDLLFEICDAGNNGVTDIFFYTSYFGYTNIANHVVGILTNDGNQNFEKTYFLQNMHNIQTALAFDADEDGDIDFLLGIAVVDKISYFENLEINLDNPMVSDWPTASDITFGEPLANSVLTGGNAAVTGQFEFVNPDFVPNAGVYSARIKFVPDDPQTYLTVYKNIDVVVHKATPVVSAWPVASDIEFGQPLSESVLTDGEASVPGMFTFQNPDFIATETGVLTVAVTFTADDADNYNTVSGIVDVTVNPATPEVTQWPTASDITFGDALSASTLSGGTASVSGTFSFDNPDIIPDAGVFAAGVTFTPDDSDNYNSVSGTVDLTINPATPEVTQWPTASDITFGEPLSSSILSGGSASVSGTFSFDNPDFIPDAGVYSADVTFTPDDSDNYNSVSGTVAITVNPATPEVTQWPTASDITFGEPLSTSVLSGGAASVSGTFSFDNPDIIPDAGVFAADVTFTPDDSDNYNSVSGTVDVTVNPATPEVTQWPVASDITFGEPLSASMLTGGTTSINGTFSFDNPDIIPDAGVFAADVTFIPDDSNNYLSVNGTVDVTINPAIPEVTQWPTASDVTFGEPLSSSILSGGTATISGMFSFDDPGYTPDAGVYAADVTFTPDDSDNYIYVSGTVDVTVNLATPEVTQWPTASDITFGEPLSASILTGGTASVSGTFSFNDPGFMPDAGVYAAGVTFTPDDSDNYIYVSGTVDVTVNLATPEVTQWPTASDITFGEPLSASTLSGGTASVSGTFSFNNPNIIPDAGVFAADVTFTPDDSDNYISVSGTVDVTVNPATPEITQWPAASDITFGEPLSASTLTGGTASVSGTFSFDNPGIIPDSGVFAAGVTFTPDDSDNYISVSGMVDVTVNPATPEVTQWPTASDITFGEPLSASTLTGGTASVSGTFSFDNPNFMPDAGVYAADVTFTPEDQNNYVSISGTVEVIVNKADQVIEWYQELEELEYGSIITLDATTSSGLPVTFLSDNTEVAVITGNELEIVGYGVAEITALQEGNQNYNPAPEVSKTIHIIPSNVNIYSGFDIKVYPVPASDYITIESPGLMDYSYFIFDNSGQLVMQGIVNQNLITTIRINHLVRGSYYLVIEINNTIVNKKIIKM